VIRRLVSPEPEIARINVTPIIDVALVLVIILLITAPMMSVAQLSLDLPRARSQVFGDELRVNVTLGADGGLAIDEDVVEPAMFPAELRQRLTDHPEDVLVVIRADSGLSHRTVSDLLRAAREGGAHRLAIATRPDTRELP
jgi:biopolymer transport protein ExbD